jgi:3-hydroxyacyl-CoA dehydrogenase
VEQYRKQGSLVSSNTSSIPIHFLAEGRSDDFKVVFVERISLIPLAILRLLEVIPTANTQKVVVNFFMDFGQVTFGKQTVFVKTLPPL